MYIIMLRIRLKEVSVISNISTARICNFLPYILRKKLSLLPYISYIFINVTSSCRYVDCQCHSIINAKKLAKFVVQRLKPVCSITNTLAKNTKQLYIFWNHIILPVNTFFIVWTWPNFLVNSVFTKLQTSSAKL